MCWYALTRSLLTLLFSSHLRSSPHAQAAAANQSIKGDHLPQLSMIEVPSNSPLFKELAFRFMKGCAVDGHDHPLFPYSIHSIKMIRNKALYRAYTAARETMLDQRGRTTDTPCTCSNKDYPVCLSLHESRVWHGCSQDAMEKIQEVGFLRDFAVAQQHGRGCYHARYSYYPLFSPHPPNDRFHSGASLDPQDRFTPVHKASDGSEHKTIILSRLLVGESCFGSSWMKTPACSRFSFRGPNAMCDTMTDGPWGSLRMFVQGAGADNRAYPEYVFDLRKV